VNIRISKYSIDFYEKFDEIMAVDGRRPTVNFDREAISFWPMKKIGPSLRIIIIFKRAWGRLLNFSPSKRL